jgi:hypothetical protein
MKPVFSVLMIALLFWINRPSFSYATTPPELRDCGMKLQNLHLQRIPGTKRAGPVVWDLGKTIKVSEMKQKLADIISTITIPQDYSQISQPTVSGTAPAPKRGLDAKDALYAAQEGSLLLKAETALKTYEGLDGNVAPIPHARQILRIEQFSERPILKQILLGQSSQGHYLLSIYDLHPPGPKTFDVASGELQAISKNPQLNQILGSAGFQHPSARQLEFKTEAPLSLGEALTRLNNVLKTLHIGFSQHQLDSLALRNIHQVNDNVVNEIAQILPSLNGDKVSVDQHEVSARLKSAARNSNKILSLAEMEKILIELKIGNMPEGKVKYLMGEVKAVLEKKGIEVSTVIALGLWNGRMGLGFSSKHSKLTVEDLERLASLKNPGDLSLGQVLKVSVIPSYQVSPDQGLTEAHTDLLASELQKAFGSPIPGKPSQNQK